MAAAVCFPPDADLDGINDSKVLSPKAREEAYGLILRNALGVSVGIVEPAEIDSAGMSEAVRLSFTRAASSLGVHTDLFIIDGLPVRGLRLEAEFVVRGDSRSLCVAAAGIVAKVTRDRLMVEADSTYPGYGFGKHKGYCTGEHLRALSALGPCPIHRRSFAPLREDLQLRLPLE